VVLSVCFGGARELQATVPPPDKPLFTGKERDAETGLDYFGARYQRAGIGRFTSVDPAMTIDENLVDPQRWNRYAYARTNPLRWVDPDGRAVVESPDSPLDPPGPQRKPTPFRWPTPKLSPSHAPTVVHKTGPEIAPAAPAHDQQPKGLPSATDLLNGTWFVGVQVSLVAVSGGEVSAGLFWSPGHYPGVYGSVGWGGGLNVGPSLNLGAIDGGRGVFEGPMNEASLGAMKLSGSAYVDQYGNFRGYSLNFPLLPVPAPVVSGAATHTWAGAFRR